MFLDEVRNNFIPNLITKKSRECRAEAFKPTTSVPYSKIGSHFILIKNTITLSLAWPNSLEKNAVNRSAKFAVGFGSRDAVALSGKQ